ncbi:MAG: CinA family protein [Thermodesulfovibrio sp.]|nr:CinA family protein [Thermodesulfovibrio sp.]
MENKVLTVIRRVHEIFKGKGLTLSVAESCTGGLISHYLTSLAGASNFFEAGVVSYSIESKKRILGVSPEIISQYGVVSDETASDMAEQIRALIKTDFSLSTTGNLGPDVLEGKDRGLVYIAISKEGQTFSKELRLKGDRSENKKDAAISAMRFLIEIVEGN